MQHFIKWGGLIGAALLGVVTIAKGDVTTGVGMIAASLSSASILPTR